MSQFNKIAATLGVVVSGLASIAANAAPADAAQSRDVPTIIVKFAPQTLVTESGTRDLYRRLVKASESVCPGPISGTHFLSTEAKECRTQALEHAVRQIGDSRLAALYAGSSKRS